MGTLDFGQFRLPLSRGGSWDFDVEEQLCKRVWLQFVPSAGLVLSIICLQQLPLDRESLFGFHICLLRKLSTLVERKQNAVVRMGRRWVYWQMKGTNTRRQRGLIKGLAAKRGELL